MNSISMIPTASLMMPDSLPSSSGKSEEMAQQFESLILSQILKQMRSTSEEEGGLFPGDKSDTYGGMFDMYFGQYLAEQGGLGLTDFVNEQLDDAQAVTPAASAKTDEIGMPFPATLDVR